MAGYGNRRLTYTVGINADITQFYESLQKVDKELRRISMGKVSVNSDIDLLSIEKAANAAGQLANELRKATNVNTGKLDLSILSRSLNQSGMSLEKYRDTITAIGRDGATAFMNVAKVITQAEIPIMRTNTVLDKLWLTMKNTVRWQLTTSALRTFIGGIQSAYNYTQDLDESLNKIRIVTQKSSEDMKEFAKQANQASKELSTTTTKYTDASLIYYQQGLPDEQVQGRTETTIDLANVTGESAEVVSEQLTAIWNNFYDGSKSLQYYADVMVALGASTASSSDEIAQGIQKFAAVANTVGLSYEYAAAALATLTANTREAPEVIGNSLKTLFARLQGLQLGGTLDDGVTLNKYSEALKAVGVNILDVNGEIKNMDILLSETATKWETLTGAQKTALAQTVAGVRQYGQFISLMDNWEDFQKNLETAFLAEGTLTEQAQIYAESWEAARKRVKASWEDVYDSLFDEKFFINFDNALSNLLDNIAKVVDSMGGLKGILMGVGYVLTQMYSGKIAEGIRNMAYNTLVLVGAEKQRAIALKQNSLKLASEAQANYHPEDEFMGRNIEFYRNQINSQIELNEQTKNFSDYQKEQIINEQKILELITERGIEYGELARKQQQASEELRRSLIEEGKLSYSQQNFNKNIRNFDAMYGPNASKENLNTAKEITKIQNFDNTNIDILIQSFTRLRSELTEAEILTERWNEANRQAESGVAGAQNKAEQLAGRLNELGISFEEVDGKTRVSQDSLAELERRYTSLWNVLVRFYGVSESEAKNFAKAISQTVTMGQRQVEALEQQGQAMDKLSQKTDKVAKQSKDLAGILVSFSNVMFSASMGLSAIQNLNRVLTDKEMDSSTALTTTLTSLAMLLPIVSKALSAYTAQVAITTTVEEGMVVVTGKGIAARVAQKIANIALAKSEGDVAAATLAAKAAAGGVGIVIAAVTIGVALLAKKIYDLATANEQAAKAMKATSETYNKSKSELQSLNQELETANNRLEELLNKDTLTVIEQEEIDKLREEIGYLERQLELTERINKQNAIANALTIEENFNKKVQGVLGKQPDLRKDKGLKTSDKWVSHQGQGTNTNQLETADEWFARVTEGLDPEKDKFKLEEYEKEYHDWIENNEAETAKWVAKTKEELNEIEQSYLEFIEGIQAGYQVKDDSIVTSMQEQLETVRKLVAGKDYGKIYLTPIVDDTALAKIKNKLYTLTDEQIQDENILSKLGLTSDQIEEVEEALLKMGVTLSSVINQVQEDVARLKENLKGLFGSFTDDFINKLSSEDLDLLISLNFENIDTIQQMYEAMANIVIETKDWTATLGEAKDAAHEALQTLSEGETLDDEIITNLQTLFDGIYNLGNLENLSTYEQAVQLSEAFMSLTDINPIIQSLNETLIDSQNQINKIDENLLELGIDGSASIDELIDSSEDFGDAWEDIEKDLLTRGALKTVVDDAIDQLDRLNDFKVDPIEIEVANIESVVAQMKQLEKAASLIGEDFKVQVENVAELAATIPEIFLDSVVDMETGIVQLSQATVDAVADSALAAAQAQAVGLGEMLQQRIDVTNAEMHLIQAVKNAAIQGSSDAVTAISKDAEDEKIKKETVAHAITLAKIQQAIEEQAQSKNTADAAVFYMNETSNASASEAPKIAQNYTKSLQSIADAAYKVFSAVADGMANPASAKKVDVVSKGGNSAGMVRGSYSMGKYKSSSGGATPEQKYTMDWLKGGASTSALVTGQNGIRSEEAMYENARIIADVINEAYGGLTIATVQTILDGTWDEQNLQATLGTEKFISGLESANSMLAKELGTNTSLLSKLAEVQDMANDLKTSGIKDKKDKKGKQGKEDEPKKLDNIDDEIKKLDEELERYHEINRAIQRQDDLLDDINNRLDQIYGLKRLNAYDKKIEQLNKQAENALEKQRQAQAWTEYDKNKLLTVFPEAQFNELGEIVNYTDLLTRNINDYNKFINDYQAFIDKYNAQPTKTAQEAMDDELEQWKQQKEVMDETYKTNTEMLKTYEESLDTLQETKDLWEDLQREIESTKLDKIVYRLEVILEIKDLRKLIRDFDKAIAESFGDYLTHGNNVQRLSYEQAQDEMKMYKEYVQQYEDLKKRWYEATEYADQVAIKDAMKDLAQTIVDSGEAILDFVNSIEEMVPQAIDAARERFELFTNQLDHNVTVLDTIRELYTLQGVTYKTMDGFNRLQKVSQEKLEAQVGQAVLQKKWFDEARQRLLEAQSRFESLGGDESDVRYDIYKKQVEALLQEYNDAQEAYLSLAKEAMETAKEMYLEQIEKAAYDFGQAVSGGIGLDLLQDKYNHYIEKEERYFDKVNEAYKVSYWYNKLQADIDKTTDSATKKRLKDLQKEIDMRREGNKLSKYDMDILEAKYKVLQAQIALEDAQNAKNKMKLVRDSQGNWNYQFVADTEEVEQAKQDLLDAENEWYNIAKQQVQDVTGEIIDTWLECQQKIKEVYSDMTLTDEERSQKAQEIYKYYTDKIKYLEEEKQVAIKDMTEAGTKHMIDMAILLGDTVADLTGLTKEEVERLAKECGTNVNEMIKMSGSELQDLIKDNLQNIENALGKDNEFVKNIMQSNGEVVDAFGNKFAFDLDKMTENTDKFEEELGKALDEMEKDFEDYGDVIEDVADKTGTNLDDLTETIDRVSDSTDDCTLKGYDTIDMLWEMIDAVIELSNYYADLAQSIMDAVYAMRDLAAQQVKDIEDYSGVDTFEPGNQTNRPYVEDYSTELLKIKLSGGDIFSAENAWLWEERAKKYQQENWAAKNVLTNADLERALMSGNQQLLEDILNNKKWFTYKYVSFDTGGYTGEFDDAKLAFLHQKELVLNQQDTENVLEAVSLAREIDGVFANIESILDEMVDMGLNFMSSMIVPSSVAPTTTQLDQTIHIDKVEFPNITSSDGLAEAFQNLTDNAAQWAKRKLD